MNKLLLFSSLLFVFAITAFKSRDGIDEVINALRSGNASELGRYIEDNVQISLPDKSDSYNKAQAINILQSFFANNGVRSFEVKHSGDNAGSQFCIGVLQTKSGSYRTTIFMKIANGKQVLKEIRFQSV